MGDEKGEGRTVLALHGTFHFRHHTIFYIILIFKFVTLKGNNYFSLQLQCPRTK